MGKESHFSEEVGQKLREALKSFITDPPPNAEEHCLKKEDIEELLGERRTSDCASSTNDVGPFAPRENGRGYPSGPLFEHLVHELSSLVLTRSCNGRDFEKYNLLDEGDYPEKRKEIFDDLKEFTREKESLWHHWSDEEKAYFLRDIIIKLGKRGLLDMFGLRKTHGSHMQFPPPKKVLLESFEQRHSDKASILTVGARALAKHHHRDSAAFWGSSTGTEAEKNKHARQVVDKILNGATWINIHELPGQLPILEMRIHEGYGARWSQDGLTFRGFLEPMMEEGWVNKYRH